jgi:hypothetical protein
LEEAMKAQATKADKSRRWRPLSQAQENAIECLLAGKTDTETAADPRVNVARQTVWEWRVNDVLFRAELQQRRATLWSASAERLRGLLGKAINNIANAIEAGDEAASWNLLKCVGLFGNGTGNAVHGANIEHELENMAINQTRKEYDYLSADGSMTGALGRLDFNEAQRKDEILAQLLDEYTEPEA